MATEQLVTISPTTNKPIITRDGLSSAEITLLPRKAEKAFDSYRTTSIKERQVIVSKALDRLEEKQYELAQELTEQVGRPIAYGHKEITTAVARGRYLVNISESTLADTQGETEKGFKRFIRKVPLGPVLILFAWNVSIAYMIYHAIAKITVSILDTCQLPHPSFVGWKFRHTQALSTDTNHSGARFTNFRRVWTAGERDSIFPLWFLCTT